MTLQVRAITGLIFGSSLIAGCDQVADSLGHGPRDVLGTYLDATTRCDWVVAYGCISASDQETRSLAEYRNTSDEELAQILASKTTYSIVSIDKGDKTATALVDVTAPDLSAVFTDILGAAFSSAFSGEETDELEQDLRTKYANGDFPTNTTRKEFALVRQQEGWRVFLDWETEAQIATLLAEAEQLKQAKKLSAALDKYDQVLELDSELVDAKEARTDTKNELDQFAEKQSYIDQVVLYDLKARYYATFLDERVPGVDFTLKNNGDRTLSVVEVTVYFKGTDGSVIAEEHYRPVLVTEYSFGDSKPLKPNYIWQMERGKFYKAEGVPTEWKEGSASARITDIEFADR